MRYRLPPLNAVRAFEAAARHQSFTRAAQELNVSQGAISRQVMILEDNLGKQLFRRLHREVQLTADGDSYFRAVQHALGILDAATAKTSTHGTDNTLNIKSLPTFAMRWLIPRLADFSVHHPSIRVRMTTSHELADFEREDVDAAVGYGHGNWKRLEAELLFNETIVPVCAPRLSGGGRPPRKPQELASFVLLHSMHRPARWRQWLDAVGVTDVRADDGPQFENSGMVCQAALDGLGIAIADLAFVKDDLAAGRLIVPFDFPLYRSIGYYLVYPRAKLRSAELTKFRLWLAEKAREARIVIPRHGRGAVVVSSDAEEDLPGSRIRGRRGRPQGTGASPRPASPRSGRARRAS
jgi:LysR family glycine cleavage system transcriptional activator